MVRPLRPAALTGLEYIRHLEMRVKRAEAALIRAKEEAEYFPD